jgi:hypothetical protein
VLRRVTRVRIAESRCELPVLYCISVPGSLTIGCARTVRTQLRLRTHEP